MGKTMRPAVAVMPPNEIIFTSSKFEQMRQTQKTTPMIKKGREKEIDNTLKKSWGSYVNKENAYEIKLPKNGKEMR